MAFHKNDDETYCISSHGFWLPGCFKDKGAANLAFRLSGGALQKLQDDANLRAGGRGGIITLKDVSGAVKALPESNKDQAEQYDEATLAGMKDFEERKKAAKIGEDGMIDMGAHKVHPDSPMGKSILGKR